MATRQHRGVQKRASRVQRSAPSFLALPMKPPTVVDQLVTALNASPWTIYSSCAAITLALYFFSRPLRTYVRLGLLCASIVLCSSYGILISLFCGAETNFYATRAFADVCEWTIGLKLVVEGGEHLEIGPSVVVYNHQSLLDILYIGRTYLTHCIRL